MIGITGVSFSDLGSQFALAAMVQHFASRNLGSLLCTDNPRRFRAERLRFGLSDLVWLRRPSALGLLPSRLLRTLRFVPEHRVSTVFVSAPVHSCFAQENAAQHLARDARRWKAHGKRVVLLPQPIGPFRDSSSREAFAEIACHADLIFALDSASLACARHAAGPHGKIALGAHFALGVTGGVPDDFPAYQKMAGVVLCHTLMPSVASAGYLSLLRFALRFLRSHRFSPILFAPFSADVGLAARLSQGEFSGIPVVDTLHPLALKGILGSCEMVLGFGVHDLACALSQGVPAAAVGESAGVRELLSDFGCAELLLHPNMQEDEVATVLSPLANHDSRSALAARIAEAVPAQQQRVAAMWELVDVALGIEK